MPAFDNPVLKLKAPLAPFAPAFIVNTNIAPLLVVVPSPLEATAGPPVLAMPHPADRIKIPPTPLEPLPTLIDTPPAEPPVDDPVSQKQLPLFP